MVSNDSTIHSIYRIVCFANGKVYVGQTQDPHRRIRDHFRDLKKNNHCNPKLQAAYNKYGRGSFYAEVIESHIPFADINDKEIWWIDHFDCYYNGYNLTKGGYGKGERGIACEWNGIVYSSLTDAARANGLTLGGITRRLECGYTCDDDLPGTGSANKTPCVWNGIEYPSLVDAAKILGITPSGMRNRLIKGYTCDNDLPRKGIKKLSPPYYWNGIEYKRIADAARACRVDFKTMYARFEKGYSCDSDIPEPGEHGRKPCTWNGVNYVSIAEASRILGMTATSLSNKLKYCSSDDDVRVRTKSCEWNGIKYQSIADAARANNITISSMHTRIATGKIADTDFKVQPRTWNGIVYESIRHCADKNGVSNHTMKKWLDLGYVCDADIPPARDPRKRSRAVG